MKIYCPKCKTKLSADADVEGCVPCPSCGESLDVSALRAATCPICGCGFEDGADAIRICPDCKTPHHDECWSENHGCSIYGCASAAHQETHTAEGVSAESDNNAGMVACPACGALHPATDLVCASCGKLLGNDLPGDSTGARLKESVCRLGCEAKAELWPRLTRNFKMLGHDMATVFRLWWGEFSRYAQFSEKTSRRGYIAFCGVNCVAWLLFSKCGAAPLVFLFGLAMFLPGLAATVRRLRDTDISPWLIFAVPILPFLVLVPSVTPDGITESSKENK